MKPCITYNDIVHINSDLYEREIYYKLKYLDEKKAAIYSLGSCACDGKGKVFRDYINRYFKEKGCLVVFNDSDYTITVHHELNKQ